MKINKTKCIGCGACGAICPDVFEVDGTSKVINNSITRTISCNLLCFFLQIIKLMSDSFFW